MAIRRTPYGAAVQTAQLLKIPVPSSFMRASSLNTRLAIQAAANFLQDEQPAMRYFVMGIGAHAYTVGQDNIALPSTRNHAATDAGLYKMIPMVVRQVGDDLDEVYRARYGLRRIENIGGVNHIVYYARRFDPTAAVMKFYLQTITNGRVTEQTEFTPTSADREPTPPLVDNQVANPLSAQVVRVSCPVTLSLDAFDVAEILNASMILHGNEDYTHVSEIGLVTGVDRVLNSDNGTGGTISFKEIVGAQIHSHVPAQLALKERRPGLDLTYDVGVTEALFVNAG
jgi:hypothetical protein